MLLKPGPLTPAERALVETHPVIGDRILESLAREHGDSLEFMGMARAIVRSHHERHDGRGYPDRLAGDAIPAAARLLAVADVYDACGESRLYKPAMSHVHAVRLILNESPGQFDPTLLAALAACHAELDRIYWRAASDLFGVGEPHVRCRSALLSAVPPTAFIFHFPRLASVVYHATAAEALMGRCRPTGAFAHFPATEESVMRHRSTRSPFWLLAVAAALAALPCAAQAQPGFDPFADRPKDPYEDIDRHARAAPKDVEGSVEKLAGYLAKGSKTEREKARAVFTWMTANIAYDHDAARTGPGERDPEKVLQIRRATCDGQSRLYEALAKAAGLEVVRITGDARTLGERRDVPDRLTRRTPRGSTYVAHGWNAVKIGSQWQVLDVTWGNRRDFRDGKITERGETNDYYFLVAPEQMIYTHLPREAKWQLLDKPFTGDDQEDLPRIRGGLFKNGLGLVSHTKAVISSGPELKVVLTAPADVVVDPVVEENGKETEGPTVLVQRTAKQAEVNLAFPKAGDYVLRLAAGKRWDERFDFAVEYQVKIEAGKKPPVLLPRGAWPSRSSADICTPLSGTLKAGRSVAFKVSLPAATAVYLKNGGRTARLVKQGQFYVGNVTPRRATLCCALKTQGSPAATRCMRP
jgi:transglutaminase-like putative cysteine protease